MSSSPSTHGAVSPSLDDIGADLQGPPPSPTDKLARKEQQELSNNDYEGKTDEALHAAQQNREESLRVIFHKIFIGGLWVVGLSLILMFIVRVLHIVLPDTCHWLTLQGLQDIDRMLFSGAAGGLVTRFLEPVMFKKRQSQ